MRFQTAMLPLTLPPVDCRHLSGWEFLLEAEPEGAGPKGEGRGRRWGGVSERRVWERG